MATKKAPAKKSKAIKPAKFNADLDAIVKQLQGAKTAAAKEFAKAAFKLTGVRKTLNSAASKLETLIRNAHGDDESGSEVNKPPGS